MKKIYSLLFAALAVVAIALVFTSCEKDDYDPLKPESKCQITFTTAKPVGSSLYLIIKKDNRPTEVIGAKAEYGQNPFDGGPGDGAEVVILVLEKQNVTIKGDITHLIFYNPELTSLDVSQNPLLEELDCSYGHLTKLDVSKNTALTSFACGNNQLTSLDVSKNIALRHFGFAENKITSIDISKNTELRTFRCDYNKLTTLDISKNTKLEALNCCRNKIKAEEMSKIINALPDWSAKKDEMQARLSILTNDTTEENEVTEADLKIAEDKNWRILIY